MNYWENKNVRRMMAVEHINLMEKLYQNNIKECNENTTLWDDSYAKDIDMNAIYNKDCDIVIKDIDSVSAIIEEGEGSTSQ